MGLREELQKRIAKKEQEIKDLELRIRDCSAYVLGLQDTLKLLPKEPSITPELSLRPGSEVAKAREILKAAGKPLHISALLEALNRPVDGKNRAALSGSLAAYVRKGEIFTRPAPNTYGLVEMEQQVGEKPEEEPPPSFGQDVEPEPEEMPWPVDNEEPPPEDEETL